ncbi:GNAT family N-acetyltransferase [Winogradskyella bathintestinalis]|uniref:GNAT family N-acetyltransferase n=1 Tax=Winogradskyella bathintestinalis TaxID=3035208 RepID=A0ABT7ZU98_9FLAO|nr:GNAT family N-acetyltransferase [Winogradskyella bathintestinalis]MDN3492605.1 GNAT family N-acetyltransferase [Winogradskyella bathintestinalis]
MSDYKVTIYKSTKQDTWNNFALKSNQDTFLFQREFMDYHSHTFRDFSLMVYKKNKLIALLPANLVENSVFSHQGLTYGGLIYANALKTTEFIQVFKVILRFLNENEITHFTIKELPTIYLHNTTNHSMAYILFKIKAELLRTDLHSVVDLNYKSYSNSRKEGVKRGVKAGLKVEESDNFETFWNEILIPNLEAKHNVKPVHNLEEISLLKSRFPNQIRQFNVLANDKIVAGTTIFETENVAHCQYISGNEDKNELGSLDFLHHHLIENIFGEKSFYDFGTSNINLGQQINKGLLFWKEGFGARSIPQRFYKIETKNYKLLDDILV